MIKNKVSIEPVQFTRVEEIDLTPHNFWRKIALGGTAVLACSAAATVAIVGNSSHSDEHPPQTPPPIEQSFLSHK